LTIKQHEFELELGLSVIHKQVVITAGRCQKELHIFQLTMSNVVATVGDKYFNRYMCKTFHIIAIKELLHFASYVMEL